MNKIKYLLAVDGGGTKITAQIIELASGIKYSAAGGQASLHNDFQTALSNIEQVINDLYLQSKAKSSEVLAVMGLAGGGSSVLSKRLLTALELGCGIKFAKLHVYSDAITSLYGANNGQPVAIVALGTGAVGARLDNHGDTQLVGGWGFLVDDFGSGARLGLSVVQRLLDEIDQFSQPQSPLTRKLSEQIGATREQLNAWLYDAKAVDYARFTYLVFELQNDCKIAELLLQKHAKQVERLINKTRAQSQLPVMLTGGLAAITLPLLSSAMQQLIIPKQGDSLSGALILAQQNLHIFLDRTNQ